MEFAKNLRRIRKFRKFTQQKLAAKSGICLATIRMYEQGKSEPSLSKLMWLAESLDTTVSVLIGEV